MIERLDLPLVFSDSLASHVAGHHHEGKFVYRQVVVLP